MFTKNWKNTATIRSKRQNSRVPLYHTLATTVVHYWPICRWYLSASDLAISNTANMQPINRKKKKQIMSYIWQFPTVTTLIQNPQNASSQKRGQLTTRRAHINMTSIRNSRKRRQLLPDFPAKNK